ncbi:MULTISPECIES: ArsR/SmtB family transcription factor [Brevibacterium]|uniref:ArsR/SmtB family transcription factor n=1 Tax=Brevibacterium TaxID=1696 RepID=UPI000301F4AF|nr:winged helix-turn-helix domain-containing protein [Brevibacterium casei]NJE66325.1 ArsR family transcriptional regulator [Brevibacterium sp. LS14]SIG90999.1 Helix-turn-helix domain [Mycobacteroides abscessus subsp. abscessus]MBE4696114.1 winged helix-turn-helix transcriptional regulator [Brevibacterium casei]MBE8147043.1 winged helix-turn-helix transcriptional regulator [Brevibacterium casei]MBY3579236.1 winged helix-turn-helix transcriptional regulator [Brevibacterium casei]
MDVRADGTAVARDAGPEDPLEERLARLEDRVAELEDAAGSVTASTPAEAGAGSAATPPSVGRESTAGTAPGRSSAGVPDAETFWALNGLVERLGAAGGVVYTGHVTPPGTESPVSWQMGLTAEAFADIDFAEAAPALTAFSHPVRLALLQAVYEGTTTVAELSADDRFGTTGQIYHHLKALASAGWLENIPRGHWRVPAQKVIPLLTLILIGTS